MSTCSFIKYKKVKLVIHIGAVIPWIKLFIPVYYGTASCINNFIIALRILYLFVFFNIFI